MSRDVVPWSPPLLRWAGSKRQLIPTLAEMIPQNIQRYVEPFAGSACLFFALRPASAIVADLNRELVSTYQTIGRHPRLVARAVARMRVGAAAYYAVRAQAPETLTEVEKAARFIYLNRYCFNGIYRVNRQGRFNVPLGTKTGGRLPESAYVRCAFALRRATVMSADYREVLSMCRRGDFVYLDPPYFSPLRTHKGEYGYGTFGPRDLPAFGDALRDLDRRGVAFVASYADAPEFSAIRAQWRARTVDVRRSVARTTVARSWVTEVIITNDRAGGRS